MTGIVAPIAAFRASRVGLLTTYRRNGQAVATPVSIAVRAGGVYFVTPATSGKARRLTVGAAVTLAPSTVSGRVTGPAIQGRAHLLGAYGRRRARRLWQPGGPLFWSYVLYRIRGHRMHVYEVRLTDPAQYFVQPRPARLSAAHVYRTVQLTARSSALLFAAAQAASALGPRTRRAPTFLYVAFMAAHAGHLTAVAAYAGVNGGRDLFPGGRSMDEVGGWPTVAAIDTLFSALAVTGWAARTQRAPSQPSHRVIGQAALWVMAAMFVGAYVGQLPRSRWYAVHATSVAGAMTANAWARRLRRLSADRPGT